MCLAIIGPTVYCAAALVTYMNTVRAIREIVAAQARDINFVPLRVNAGDQDLFVRLRDENSDLGGDVTAISSDARTFRADAQKSAQQFLARFFAREVCEGTGCIPERYKLELIGVGVRIDRPTGKALLPLYYISSYALRADMGSLSKEPDGEVSLAQYLTTIVSTSVAHGERFVYALPSALYGTPRGQFYGNWRSREINTSDAVLGGAHDAGYGNYLELTFIVGVEARMDLSQTWYGKVLSTVLGDSIPLLIMERTVALPRNLI